MLGTKCPSITSMWRIVAPACSTAWISSASRAKSAASIDGAIAMRCSKFLSYGRRKVSIANHSIQEKRPRRPPPTHCSNDACRRLRLRITFVPFREPDESGFQPSGESGNPRARSRSSRKRRPSLARCGTSQERRRRESYQPGAKPTSLYTTGDRFSSVGATFSLDKWSTAN